MIKLSHIIGLIKGKRPPEDVLYYIQGEYRMKLFYSRWKKWLLREHIADQIEARLRWMDEECYNSGECKICGCETIALQCADKSCDKPCYPPMMSRKNWEQFMKLGKGIKFPDGTIWMYRMLQDRPIILLTKEKKDVPIQTRKS